MLSDDEIRILIRKFDETRYGRAVRLLFLTGLRRDEVLGMKWSWLDLGKGLLTIPPENDKVGRIRDEPRRAGLCPMAVTLLTEQRAALFAEGVSSEYVFATSTGGRPWDSLKPILYDLRGRRPSGKPGSQHTLAKKRVAVLPDDVQGYGSHSVAQACEARIVSRVRDTEPIPAAIADYIDGFYNPVRRHSSIDYASPVEFELK